MTDKPKQFICRPIPNDQSAWQELSEYLTSNEHEVLTVTVEFGEPKKRSLSANALQAVWIKEIAEWQGDSEHSVRLWVKAKIALPVLIEEARTEAEKDRARRVMKTLKAVGYFEMSDENKMRVIELIEVTSAMSSRQHSLFRKQMQRHYGNMGLPLEVR